MVNIAFKIDHFSIRGTECAIFSYANYNESILQNKSLIVVPKEHRLRKNCHGMFLYDDSVYQKFLTRFKIIEYSSLLHLKEILSLEKCNILYQLKSGENDGFIVESVKNVVHCVFTYNYKHHHGEVYLPISPAVCCKELNEISDIIPYVPHIIDLERVLGNLRQILNIPIEATVFGRHGGNDTFNIPFVHSTIYTFAKQNPSIYFLFLNTDKFCEDLSNIIYLNANSSLEYKSQFINTCDAMIHARKEGESFGLAIAEFSIHNKPVITWKHPPNNTMGIEVDLEHTFHHTCLGENGIYYQDSEELSKILQSFNKHFSVNCYVKFSPENVMKIFNEQFINTSHTIYDSLKKFTRNGLMYWNYSDFDQNTSTNEFLDICNKFLKSNDNVVSIGSNVGFEILQLSSIIQPFGKLIAFEPHPGFYPILSKNLDIHAKKNVSAINVAISDKSCEGFMTDSINLDLSVSYTKQPTHNYRVDCKELDNVVKGDIKLLNINCSKGMLNVLKGAVLMLLHFRPNILVKHNNSHEYILCKTLLKSLKYTTNITGKYSFWIANEKQDSIFCQEVTPMIRIKMMCNWSSSKELCIYWNKMTQGNFRWNNLQICWDDANIDYFVIINKPLKNEFFIPSKTIVFRMEPDLNHPRWNDWYLSKSDFLWFLDFDNHRNNTEWHLGSSYKELSCIPPIIKTKTISSIVSSLYQMPGHKLRIDFLKYLQSCKFDIDIFGHTNEHNFQPHCGSLPHANKIDAIFPYKYTFIAENCDLKNYFTEKICDSILGETLCFYWGCSNLESYINPSSYIRLDLTNFEISKQQILDAIANDEWSKRIEIIKTEKKKILDHYSTYPRIEGLLMIKDLKTLVINLDRRPDRYLKFTKNAIASNFTKFSRVSALDGKIIKSIPKSFKNFVRKPKMGEIGCALSHLKIWQEVVTKNETTLILEDDSTLNHGFVDRLAMIYRYMNLNKSDFDVLFVGYHLNLDVLNANRQSITEYRYDSKNNFVRHLSEMCLDNNIQSVLHSFFGGGTFGYIITPKCADKMANHISSRGFRFPVDYEMMNCANILNMNMYAVIDPLVFSPMYEPNNPESQVDTDIQQN